MLIKIELSNLKNNKKVNLPFVIITGKKEKKLN